jgi:hypothetical protein
MPYVYSLAPATSSQTNGAANTETNHLRTFTGAARSAAINALYVFGKGAGLTAISGIGYRLKRMSAASTVGTDLARNPRSPNYPAAALGANTLPTNGTAAAYQLAIGSGAAGPGGWVAPNPDSMIQLEAGNSGGNGNVDLFSASGSASLFFEYSLEFQE